MAPRRLIFENEKFYNSSFTKIKIKIYYRETNDTAFGENPK